MYQECLNENKYKNEAYELLKQFDYHTQQKAVKAIQDLFSSEHQISWQFIATALKKKSKDNYKKYGFGIMFNNGFIASVYKEIERDLESSNIDVDEYFNY